MSCESETAALLRAAGQKVTPQRMLILRALRHASGHVTAAAILEEVRASYPFIDASTVYRTLSAARALNLVSETNLGSGDTLFEWIGTHRHHHLVCRGCKASIDLEDHFLDDLAEAIEKETGFRPHFDHMSIFGLCPGCREAAIKQV